MKRSRHLRLSLLGAAPLALTACGQRAPENLVYETLSDCLSDSRVSSVSCNTAYNRAISEHARSAPRYPSLNACQDIYGPGRCDALLDASGNPYFAPRMSGFMVGRYVPPPTTWYGHSYGHSTVVIVGDWSPRPLYRTSSDWDRGSWSTGSGKTWSGSSQATKISTASVSRGGFGGSSAARSSWGG